MVDVAKLKNVPVDLNKHSNAVKIEVAKNTIYDELAKKVNAIMRTTDNSDLVKRNLNMTQKLVKIKK